MVITQKNGYKKNYEKLLFKVMLKSISEKELLALMIWTIFFCVPIFKIFFRNNFKIESCQMNET